MSHGHAKRSGLSPEYNSWRGMIERCEAPSHVGFKYYGARGILVCERWRGSFQSFLSDMGPRPPGMTLDRFPNTDGNYEPGNCRWATPSDQRANQRDYDESVRVRAAWVTRSRMAKGRVDLTGQRFSRLLATAYHSTKNNRAMWKCVCDCGVEVVVAGKSLRQKNTKSCGCLNKELTSGRACMRNRIDNPAKYRWG